MISSLRGPDLPREGHMAVHCGRRTAEHCDELAPTAVDCHVALPWEVMPTQRSDDIMLHALAVLRFMNEFVPCTGWSAG